ncbi:hypothetical protein OHA10_18205 [Kribbella sp. NBC_00662]|uniref:hypothetical protein n=1 Tax=Kribbella sp. NBC_00662 TaxID=2975969 RepID=UPI003244E7FA
MRSPSHELLGDTDPREHGPGWRYVMVPLSARGAKLRSLVGPDSRIARAHQEDAYTVNPDRVGIREPWEATRDGGISHKPVLIDANHPPEHAGLIVAMPPEHLYLTLTSEGPITGHDLMAEEGRMGRPVYLNSTFGEGVTITGVVVPQQQDGAGPVSAWDAEWLSDLAAERGLPVIETVGADNDGLQQVRSGPDGWHLEVPDGQTREGGRFPLRADGDFRSIETEYAEGLLMYPQQVGKAMEDLSTAGVGDEELRALAAGYEQAVNRNEAPQVSMAADEAVLLSVRDDTVSEDRYGRYEQETVVRAGGAFTWRIHDQRYGEIVEATHPELTHRLVEAAKQHHPDLAPQLDALYEQARIPNAVRWAHEQRMGGRIPDGVRQVADRWAGGPIDWQVVQHQAERATAQDWARVAGSVAASGSPVTLITNEGVSQYQPSRSLPERGGRAD